MSNSERLSLFRAADYERELIDEKQMSNATRVFTPAAQQAQAERGSSKAYERRIAEGFPDHVTAELAKFIAEQDTAFIATATADGAPYIQHRGGPKGFIKVIDAKTLGFADYRGNRQYITLANLSDNDHAFLFLLDPARRQRIKIWGRARIVENDPALIERLFDQGYKARPKRVILFTITRYPVHDRGLGRELFCAHCAALYGRRDRGGFCRGAGEDRGTGGGKRTPARRPRQTTGTAA